MNANYSSLDVYSIITIETQDNKARITLSLADSNTWKKQGTQAYYMEEKTIDEQLKSFYIMNCEIMIEHFKEYLINTASSEW